MNTKPSNLNETESVVYDMLTENTGQNLVDSGGAYGRMYEINRQRNLKADPPASVSWRHQEILVTLSTFHFLVDRVVFEPRLDAIFRKWCNRGANNETPWSELVQSFPEWLSERCPKGDLHSPFDYDSDAVFTYTYNDANMLSQDLTICAFSFNDEDVYIIGSHNGCDARWGFSSPRVFTGIMNSEWSLFDYNRATIVCDAEARRAMAHQPTLPGIPAPPWPDQHVWAFDGGHWRSETWPHDGEPDRLDACTFYYDEDDGIDNRPAGSTHIIVTEDGTALCPKCRTTLTGYPQ